MARCSFITVTCNASTFGPEGEERILRREFFLALEETKGFGLGIKRRNCARTTATFSRVASGFSGGQGFIICQRLGKDGI